MNRRFLLASIATLSARVVAQTMIPARSKRIDAHNTSGHNGGRYAVAESSSRKCHPLLKQFVQFEIAEQETSRRLKAIQTNAAPKARLRRTRS